jgi:hypothetical protein|tara:strand:+ start:236 stop:445 length:210 start_codon:yes stop_codon:yes gene_type:complete
LEAAAARAVAKAVAAGTEVTGEEETVETVAETEVTGEEERGPAEEETLAAAPVLSTAAEASTGTPLSSR